MNGKKARAQRRLIVAAYKTTVGQQIPKPRRVNSIAAALGIKVRKVRKAVAMIAVLLIAVGLTGCPKQVTRNKDTLIVETMAALARQTEASEALMLAAADALDRGDVDACITYATPALLIDASAQAQAYRALWLAGLPYPGPDGQFPTDGAEQPDPGPSTQPPAAEDVCVTTRGE